MAIIPCEQNIDLRNQIEAFAEVLKTEAHKLGNHGLSEVDFYQGGLFRGAIERIRGQYSATMAEKRAFVQLVLNHMQDANYIREWESSGQTNRHDYSIVLPNGRIAVVELKGCLDGNNTTIFQRPGEAQEFYIWSVCSNSGSDPRKNAWSGIHTRLSAEIINEVKQVDGLIIWDWVCGTIGRPCPKLSRSNNRLTKVGQYQLTPPCIYLFPSSVPSVDKNPNPTTHRIEDLGFLSALHNCFGGLGDEINSVCFNIASQGTELVRTTTIDRAGVRQIESDPISIRRQ